jgi:hypothetical protein
MPKPRQGQRKQDGTTATPKPLCKKHKNPETGEIEPVIMERFWIMGKNEKGTRCMKKRGWICPECYPTDDSEIEITK